MSESLPTLILGLGNPVLSDDAVGLRVVERLRKHSLSENVRTELAGTAGLGLLDLLGDCRRLIVVDAVEAGAEPGTVLVLDRARLEQLWTRHAASSHDLDLSTALELAARLGRQVPELWVVAVQVADTTTFSEQLTPAVEAAVDEACRRCRELVGG